MSIEAMKQALEALEWQQQMLITAMQYSAAKGMTFLGHPPNPNDAITALRTAIEQAEKQRGPVVGTKTWLENGEVKTKNVYMADLYDEPPAAPVQELERLRDENERLHVENRRLIDRIETMGVPVGVGGFLTTTNAAQRPVAKPHKWVHATEWRGLTDEQISDLWCEVSNTDFVTADTHVFARAIEAKLKEKNGY